MADNKIKVSLLEKLKLLVWLNSFFRGGSKMGKLLAKLDGLKSVVGLLMVTAYYVVPAVSGASVPDPVLKIGTGIAGVGLMAKMEKGLGLLTKALSMAHKVIDILDKVVKALAPTVPPKP